MALQKDSGDTRTPKRLARYTVGSPVTLPSASRYQGAIIFVSDEGGSPELGTIAVSNGTDWINVTNGAAVGD